MDLRFWAPEEVRQIRAMVKRWPRNIGDGGRPLPWQHCKFMTPQFHSLCCTLVRVYFLMTRRSENHSVWQHLRHFIGPMILDDKRWLGSIDHSHCPLSSGDTEKIIPKRLKGDVSRPKGGLKVVFFPWSFFHYVRNGLSDVFILLEPKFPLQPTSEAHFYYSENAKSDEKHSNFMIAGLMDRGNFFTGFATLCTDCCTYM